MSELSIRRLRRGKGFVYLNGGGAAIRGPDELERIRALAIPPAWTDVRICRSPLGRLQATGQDARGRKQYRYHAAFRARREEHKYDRLASFARALPRIRREVRRDLQRPGLPREKVVATVVRLLESTFIRVGNESYARENGSYGLTTLRNRHVRVDGDRIHFQFRGKSGKEHSVELEDPQLARIVRRCRSLPGGDLFQYLEGGAPHAVDSADVNAYLQRLARDDYSAKDFRTWGGTLLTGLALSARPKPRSASEAKREIAGAVRSTAAELGNTPAICRQSYLHPRIVRAYETGRLQREQPALAPRGLSGLSKRERRILAVIENRP